MKFNKFLYRSGQYIALILALLIIPVSQNAALAESQQSHIKARMDPLHFKPAIETATNEQCLQCHQEILQRKPREVTQAGVKSEDTLAWYQTVHTYVGKQDTFHRRHLRHLLAESDPLNAPDDADPPPILMTLNCNTCHQGHNINKEVTSDVHSSYSQPAFGKKVATETCLMCHGKFDYNTMPGITGPWLEVADAFSNNCMACHSIFRTNSHNVNFLNKEGIQQAGATDGETCFGCHGGRSWYKIAYPYARNPWPGMSPIIPHWAKDRATKSRPRFLIGIDIDKPAAE